MLLIFIRVLLSWFGSIDFGVLGEILRRITDPYIFWFRRFPILQQGTIDLSPIAAMAALSLASQIFNTAIREGRISVGIILAMALVSVWSAVSFILGFCAVILGLSLIAYLTNQNIHTPFWSIVNSISQPLFYRTNRLIFRKRIVKYRTGLVASIAIMIGLIICIGFLINIAAYYLIQLPV
jgi:YggT family protein